VKGKGAAVQVVQEIPTQEIEAKSLNRIRVETALSRFPIHRLAKKDTVTIDLQHLGENGEPDFKWEVTYNQKHGQPGPLAYKVDTLIVNRQIEAAGRPLPGVVKLGSLTELCTALGQADSGENRANLKKALHQNASAYITAKIRYRTKTGKEKWSEIGYTRYSVIFTGEVLPDGTAADAVYIVPNPSYRDLLNHVEVRPLDYDYLASLTPGAQRLYELLSFQMYGALAGGRPRAKLLYSEYCTHAPQARYFDFDRVKKQMFKLHVPHREAGYIEKVDYELTIDGEGAPDWEILYTPGVKAVAEFEAFTHRQLKRTVEAVTTLLPAPESATSPTSADEPPLLAELTKRGIAERKARELLANIQPGQEVLDQLEYVDQLVAKDARGKLSNPPGLYVMYVRDNVLPPPDFTSSRRKALLVDARRRKRTDQASAAKRKLDYEAFCVAETTKFITNELAAEEHAALLDSHRRQNRALLRHMTDAELEEITRGTVRSEIQHSGKVRVPTFEEFSNLAR
jgi:hypothetical protein